MCGINVIYKHSSISLHDIECVKAMNSEMFYRGPDDEGLWHDENVVLGMRRLSIIGLSNGHQPLENEDKTIFLVCNGEIYNYHELKNNLIKKGHKFATDSDCEVILHLYEEDKLNLLDHLRGMFAFALWDSKNKKLFVARDRTGQKPLYFSNISTGYIFSSELKTISKHCEIQKELDYNSIRDILNNGYAFDTRHTFLSSIKRILPGEYVCIDDHGVKFCKYWKPVFQPTYKGTFSNACDDIMQLLNEAVVHRLQSDVPVAILQSGGIDSSLISILAASSGKEIHAITAGYKGKHHCDERAIAKSFIERIDNVTWHQIELDISDFSSYYDEFITCLDEPIADISVFAQWGLYKKCRELGFTVLLSGIGGDELFFGYPTHNKRGRYLQTRKKFSSYLPLKRRSILPFIGYCLKNFFSINEIVELFLSDSFFNPYNEKCDKVVEVWPDKNSIRRALPQTPYVYEADNGYDQIYALLFSTWLVSDCHHISDKLGMGNSVEVRAPFMDHKLIELILSLPIQWRYKEGKPKWLLKKIIEGIIPKSILNAPKAGFTPPLDFVRTIIKEKKGNLLGNTTQEFLPTVMGDVIRRAGLADF